MRYEWKGSYGQMLYIEKCADGVIETNAGPDDLEAQEEILRLAAALKTADERIALVRIGSGRLAQENRRLHFGLAAARTENDSLRAELTRRGHEILALQGEKAALFAGRFPEVATRIQALEEENLALKNRVIEAEEAAESDRRTSAQVFEQVERLGKENERLREIMRQQQQAIRDFVAGKPILEPGFPGMMYDLLGIADAIFDAALRSDHP